MRPNLPLLVQTISHTPERMDGSTGKKTVEVMTNLEAAYLCAIPGFSFLLHDLQDLAPISVCV